MRKWEDIVKDKMEAFDEALPERVFAEFHAIRRGATPAPAPKRFPLVWALVPAVAAGLATVLFLRQPSTPDDGIQVVQQPVQPIREQPLFARAASPKATGNKKETEPIAETIEETPSEETPVSGTNDTEAQDSPEIQEPANDNGPIVTTAAPAFLPEGTRKAVKPKVGPVAGVIAGGGLVAAVAAPLSNKVLNDVGFPVFPHEGGGIYTTPSQMVNVKHLLPIKWGLSTRIAISERLYFTTGLDYILYRSQFTYPTSVTGTSGADMQRIHYLGIPLRLDWTLLRGKWLDVYLGAGLEGTFCVAAQFERMEIVKNPAGLSFLGVGGVQLNLTQRLGLYLEPQLSYTIPFGTVYQKTYQTEHTCMFLVSSGLRITIGK